MELNQLKTPEQEILREEALEIIRGGYDLHTHTTPSAFPRALNDFELVQEADALGMKGVMIKAHYGDTASRAALVNLTSGCTARAYGGLVLNHPTGGLNPYSVEHALRMGACIIWMPTRDAANCLKYGDMPGDFFSRPGITIFTGDRQLHKEVYEIFEIIKSYDAYLATGHLSLEETAILCQEGRAMGVNMLLTHPEWSRTQIPGRMQKELSDMGVLIEKNWLNLAEGDTTISEMAETIRSIGPSRVYLSTDRGQAGAEHPAEAMLRFIETLLAGGFSRQELIMMVRTVPAEIVNR